MAGVTVAEPESTFRVLVLTDGVILTLEAPVTTQAKLLDWPGTIVAGWAEKELMVGRETAAPPPPPPPPPEAGVTVTVVCAVVVPR